MTHPLVTGWVIEKYGLPKDAEVRIVYEYGNDGGCETCGYGGKSPGLLIQYRLNGGGFWVEVEKYTEASMGDILDEVLNWSTS